MKAPKKLRGIRDFIPFLDYLDSINVFYRIEKCRYEAIMVTFTVIRARIELEFFDDHIEYSVFRGSEDVSDDDREIFRIISDYIK